MNKKKIIMSTMLVLSMTFGGLVGCSNQTSTTTQITQNNKKTKTLGTKSAESKSLKVANKTGKPITVFEVKSSSDESFGENLLTKGDVIKKGEKCVLYYETKDEETLSIKVGLKDSDSTFTFDKVDETEKIQNVEISLNKENKVELTVNKKDDSKITIEASADETKTEGEKQNDETSESTAKVEESKSDSNTSKSETKSDKVVTTTSKTENKQPSSANNTTTSNKSNNSSSSNSSSSQHTHNWLVQTKTVHHEATYTKKYVIDQEGKDVQLPQYETVEIHVGNQSGLVISGDPNEYLLNNSNGDNGWHSEFEQKLVGYETTHQDEIGHWEDVLVQDAYDEVVTTGYKCSTCGKTK